MEQTDKKDLGRANMEANGAMVRGRGSASDKFKREIKNIKLQLICYFALQVENDHPVKPRTHASNDIKIPPKLNAHFYT